MSSIVKLDSLTSSFWTTCALFSREMKLTLRTFKNVKLSSISHFLFYIVIYMQKRN